MSSIINFIKLPVQLKYFDTGFFKFIMIAKCNIHKNKRLFLSNLCDNFSSKTNINEIKSGILT